MFYIYSPHGRVFSGPMERLRKVEKSNSAASMELHKEDRTEDGVISANEGKHHYEVSDKAVAEYQSLLRENSAREAVYHACQIMSEQVVSIQQDQSLQDAFELFENYPYQAIPILNNRRGLIALLSRRRLYHELLSNGMRTQDNHSTPVSSLINDEESVISADPVTDVRRIATALVEHKLDAVPIVEASERLVGIVSRTDVLRAVTTNPPLSLWC